MKKAFRYFVLVALFACSGAGGALSRAYEACAAVPNGHQLFTETTTGRTLPIDSRPAWTQQKHSPVVVRVLAPSPALSPSNQFVPPSSVILVFYSCPVLLFPTQVLPPSSPRDPPHC